MDKAILRAATRILSILGYTSVTATEGGKAVELYAGEQAAGRPFDVVILDLTVPGGLGGKDTLVRIREVDPAARAIVSSGYSNDPVMGDHRAFGFDGILTKPYGMAEMQEALVRIEKEIL